MSSFDDPAATNINTYQHIASEYANRHTLEAIPPFWREHLERFITSVQANPAYQAQPTLPILDIGCGPGRDAIWLAQHRFHVLATDISQAMLDEARQRSQHQPGTEHITFRLMDMHRLDLPAHSCSGLWVSASFLHIPKQENSAVLRELVRVLLPGGPLTLLVKERDQGDAERYELHAPSGMQRFFAFYSGSELWDLLTQNGLQVQEIRAATDPANRRWLGALAIKPEAE